MATKQTTTESTFYKNLLAHSSKQFKDIQKITKAYIINKQVYAIDYLRKDGINSFASNTFDADIVVIVK
jgi:hypothetical protein